MKLLIADDDDKRAKRLVASLLEGNIIEKDNITIVSSLNEARETLRVKYFDAMILDVVIPRRADRKDPHFKNGLSLLQELCRENSLNKPEKIIGITAYLDEMDNIRSEFEAYCLTVIEARSGNSTWIGKLQRALEYTATSKLGRAHAAVPLHVVTVHGIRTFGEWQNRLKTIVQSRAAGVEFHHYKYGYYSALSFFIPPLRQIQVHHLASKLTELFRGNSKAAYAIYSHSFGTFLVAEALKKIVLTGLRPNICLVVVSGSVLKNSFDWNFMRAFDGARVVNECNDGDLALLFSEAFVLGTGMAGRTGFYGLNDRFVINRHYKGGHSDFFRGDNFMIKRWVPLLQFNEEFVAIDEREPSEFFHGILNSLAGSIGLLKPYLYLAVFGLLIYVFSK